MVVGPSSNDDGDDEVEEVKRNVQLDRYVEMAREALGERKYDAAKSYAILADMQNKRENGAYDDDIKTLYDEAKQIAEELLSDAERCADKKYFIAAKQKFSDIASYFVYLDLGKTAKGRAEEVQKELASKGYSVVLQEESKNVFAELMGFMSASWNRNKADIAVGAKVEAIDIVRAMTDAERKNMGKKIDEFISFYGSAEYGQKIRKLKLDLRVAGIKTD